ncbi:MAG: rhamnulokinase, partial [Planctomycetales bacterium]|nr:rhamnulokinase [Planctomycetales bacterium]
QLCQMTASACDRPVLAGPVEATAIGNVVMQAISRGTLGSIAEARDLIRASFPLVEYSPKEVAPWDNAFERFCEIVK